MNLLRTSLLSLIATSVKMLSLLVINKFVALVVGPNGLAMIAQFQNFSQITTTVAQGGLNNGVVKYTAEYRDDHKELSMFFSTALKTSVLCAITVGGITILASEWLSESVLGSVDFRYVFILSGLLIPLVVINQLLMSVLNGLKEIRLFISSNIIQSLYNLLATILLVLFFGLYGALLALVTGHAVVLFILLWRLRGHVLIYYQNFTSEYSINHLRNLGGYSLMALGSSLSVPVSHMLIRNSIGDTLGWDAAGYWQAVWYISVTYLSVITLSLSVYFLPTFSEVKTKAKLIDELTKGYLLLIPFACCIALLIFLLRHRILELLFSDEFSSAEVLFFWQLIGDVIKMCCFLISNLLIAKAMVKMFIVKEVFISLLFYLLAVYLVSDAGLIGVSYAHALSAGINLIYLGFCLIYCYSRMRE